MNGRDGRETADAVIYVRSAVDPDGSVVARQEAACRQFCASGGLPVVGVCRDIGPGGDSARLAGWEGLAARVRAGEVATVVVWTVDRLARSRSRLVELLGLLDACGVRLLTVRDGFDSAAMSGRTAGGVLTTAGDVGMRVGGVA
jgi:DNA invertase Pin-like site-specific DNA recombinase